MGVRMIGKPFRRLARKGGPRKSAGTKSVNTIEDANVVELKLRQEH